MSFEVSDQGAFQITKVLFNEFLSQKRMNELDPDNLKEFKHKFIKPLYPHKNNNQKYTCEDYCCELNPGRFCCCSSTAPDHEYKQFGIGLCLYVKFTKHLTMFLFFVAILSIVSIAIYQLIGLQTGFLPLSSYDNALFASTIGIISSQNAQCSYSEINSLSASFTLSCEIGQITRLTPVFTNRSLQNVKNCGRQNFKYLQNSYRPSYTETITSTSTYQQNITLTLSTNVYQNYTYSYLAYNYQCTDVTYTMASKSTQGKTAIYVTICIDLFILFAFILFLWSEYYAERAQSQNFKLSELALHDFTVKVSGFSIKMQEYERELAGFIEKANDIKNMHVEKSNNDHFIRNIVQVKVPQIQQLKKASLQRKKQYQKMYKLIQQCFLDQFVDINQFTSASDFIKRCYGSPDAPQYIRYKQLLTKRVHKFMEAKRIGYLESSDSTFSILMVLTNPKHKRSLLVAAKNNCFGNYIKANGKKYYLKQPPVADMVIWDNKYRHTTLRVIFAWVITLGICLCSYLLVGFAKFKQQQSLNSNQYNLDCGLIYSSTELATWSDTLSSSSSTYLHCYCSTNYFSISSTASIRTKCSDWFSAFFVYKSIPILISLGIVLYNIIVSRIFRALSTFQCHNYLSTQLYSYIIKRSFMLVMNMGLIIILLKFNFKENTTLDSLQNISFLFLGVYSDITADWYYQIGVIIMLTLAINILVPVFDMLLVAVLKFLRKCWDRRCWCRKTSQKTKKGYIQLYSDDVFPLQERYSDFIAMIVITLAFGAVMPVLYLIAFLSIWFTFICDKLLLFNIYQRPINFNKDLQNNVFRVLYFCLLMHCVTSAFILSEPHISQAAGISTSYTRFQSILNTPYLLPYVVIFCFLAGWALFYSTIIKFFSYCSKKCEKKLETMYRSKLHQNFYKALNQYQINRLKMSMQMQLNSCTNDSNINQQNVVKQICRNTLNRLLQAERNKQKQQDDGNIKLIGKAGYDEMFDDDTFNRERKIKSIDYQVNDILKNQRRYMTQLRNQENTLENISIKV